MGAVTDIKRLESIEANAWASYRKAAARAKAKPSAAAGAAAIDEGARWQARNDDLWEVKRKAEIQARKELTGYGR